MKKSLVALNFLYPMPVVLVGAVVQSRPNYLPVAHVGIIDPRHVSISLNRTRYTNQGIHASQYFSLNMPTASMVEKVDYCGLVSGRDVDKSQLFETFFGVETGAPMIRECPLNMECRLTEVLDRPEHEVFIGQVVAAHCDEDRLTSGVPDIVKINPLVFAMNDRGYWQLSERKASAWSVGKRLKKRE